MMWKSASVVFVGGTEELKALYGRRVKAIKNLDLYEFDNLNEDGRKLEVPIKILESQQGFIAHPYKTFAIIAFPNVSMLSGLTIEKLERFNKFKCVAAGWNEFRRGFMIEDITSKDPKLNK